MNKKCLKLSALNKIRKKLFLGIILLLMMIDVTAQQYNICGTAIIMTNPNCYRLTNTTSQGGAVWNIYKINLTQPFDITLSLNFGSNIGTSACCASNCGADGMSFVLQPLSSSVVSIGGAVGFNGITPSLGVVMDDFWGNPTDPPYHHISINKNGDVLHGGANEIQAYSTAIGFPANITDGLDHLFRFKWTPTPSGVGTIQVYFGTATTLPTTATITYTGNIVAGIFNNDPNVYWGVSGSTGGCWNNQYVCMTTASNFTSPIAACVGDTVHFTDNSISGLPVQVYSWDFGDNTYSSIQNATHVYANPGTYNVNLAIFNSGGFFSTMTHSLVINPKPNVVVNNPSICKGDTAILTATGANSYTWNSGLTPGAVKKVAPIVTTSYIVTGTNTFGCINKDTALVTINPNPIVTATTDSICIGDTATLFASGANTYKWTPTSSTLNPLKVSPGTTTNYLVVGTNTFGCKDSTTTKVVVNPNPIIHAVNDTICLYETASLTVTGASTYVWGNNIATGSPFTVSPLVTTTYIVVGTDVNNCIGKDSAKVVVNYPPDIAVDSAEICAGLTGTLHVTGGTNLAYLWTNDNSTLNQMNALPNGTTTYTVIATDINGCKDTASGIIKVHPKPIPAFYATPSVVSTDLPDVVFTDVSTFAFSWSWNFGDITSSSNTSTQQFPSHTYNLAGEFIVWLHVTSDYGCQDSTNGKILVSTPNTFYIPNAFDPTNTDININVFKPKGTGIDLSKYQLLIFDRWGKQIFSTTDYEEGWNGKYNNAGEYLTHGVYVYYIRYKELYGTYREKTGSVTLLR